MTKREMKQDLLGGKEYTPSPDSYNLDKCVAGNKSAMATIEESENMPSSAFKSTSAKTMKTPQQNQPGPGAYEPVYDSVTPTPPGTSMNSNLVSKVGRDIYFGASDIGSCYNAPTDGHVGPGVYTPEVTNDGEINTIEKRATKKASSGWSMSFVSDSLREMWTALVRNDSTLALAA